MPPTPTPAPVQGQLKPDDYKPEDTLAWTYDRWTNVLAGLSQVPIGVDLVDTYSSAEAVICTAHAVRAVEFGALPNAERCTFHLGVGLIDNHDGTASAVALFEPDNDGPWATSLQWGAVADLYGIAGNCKDGFAAEIAGTAQAVFVFGPPMPPWVCGTFYGTQVKCAGVPI